jgi:hypothetical protein
VVLSVEVTYYVCVSLIKISILCMYLRFGAFPLLPLKGSVGGCANDSP